MLEIIKKYNQNTSYFGIETSLGFCNNIEEAKIIINDHLLSNNYDDYVNDFFIVDSNELIIDTNDFIIVTKLSEFN